MPTIPEMPDTARWRQGVIRLAVVLISLQGAACAGESSSATGREGGADAAAPERAAAPPPQQAEGGAASGGRSLAEEMRALTAAADDAAAANTALMNILPDLADFEVDEAAVLALGREYLAAGDDAMAEVVFSYLQMAAYQVTGEVSADLWAAHGDVSLARGETARAQDMYEVALDTDPGHAYSKEKLASMGSGGAPPATVAPSAAPPAGGKNRLSEGRRPDLARFRYRYADAEGSGRELWISETCYNSGVLRAVPQWGSASPWVFESVSDAVFEQVDAPAGAQPVRLEFQLHHGHEGTLGVVVSGGASGSFDVAGYLPEGFEPEIGTCD